MRKVDAARAGYIRRADVVEYVNTLRFLVLDFYGQRDSGDELDADESIDIYDQ